MKNNNTLIAISLSLMACILWSGNFVVARGVHEWMNPIGFAFWRWVVAFVCILPLAAKHYRTNIVYFKQNPKPYILMGVIGVGVFNTLIYEAAHYTSANNIALLAATSPIWTLFLAGILKFDELNKFKIAGIFIAFFGALTIILKGNYADIVHLKFNFGDLLVFIASWFWATYSILLKKKHPQMNSFFLMGLIVVFGLAVLTPFYAIEIYFKGFTPFSANALYAYLYVGIGASVMAWYLFNQSVFMIGPVRTSLIYYTMPVFSGVLSIIYLGEHFYSYHITGFLLVLGGIVVSNIRIKS
jgi:drug/metabolite transporter (DMT)-like permease